MKIIWVINNLLFKMYLGMSEHFQNEYFDKVIRYVPIKFSLTPKKNTDPLKNSKKKILEL